MVFGWFKSKRTRLQSKLIRSDRKYLEARSRRFLQSYLKADESRKPHFYRAVEGAVHKCQAEAGVDQPSNEQEDAEIATATSSAAMKVVLERIGRKEDNGNAAFLTDAYATIAIAYHRAAGVYIEDRGYAGIGHGCRSPAHDGNLICKLPPRRGSDTDSRALIIMSWSRGADGVFAHTIHPRVGDT